MYVLYVLIYILHEEMETSNTLQDSHKNTQNIQLRTLKQQILANLLGIQFGCMYTLMDEGPSGYWIVCISYI